MTQQEFASNPEILCRQVLLLPPDDQDAFWKTLQASGAFKPEEIQHLQELVGLYRLHTDLRYRKMIQAACFELYSASCGKGVEDAQI